MNVDAFVAAREAELARFVHVMAQQQQQHLVKAPRAVPIRPLAADALRRPCRSPFDACPELDRAPRVPSTARVAQPSSWWFQGKSTQQHDAHASAAAAADGGEDGDDGAAPPSKEAEHERKRVLRQRRQEQRAIFNLRRELRRSPKHPAMRHAHAELQRQVRRRRNQQAIAVSSSSASRRSSNKRARKARRLLRKRLLLRRRRFAKRAAHRRMSVQTLGFRLCIDQHQTPPGLFVRAYTPSHSFLAKRFTFGDVGAVLRLECSDGNDGAANKSGGFAPQPWTAHHFAQFGSRRVMAAVDGASPASLPVRVTVPRASFTKKSFHRVERARGSVPGAVFDVSFVASTQYVGACTHARLVPAMVQTALSLPPPAHMRRGTNRCTPNVVGDGYAVSLLDVALRQRNGDEIRNSCGGRVAAVEMFGRVVLTVSSPNSEGTEVFFATLPLNDGGNAATSAAAAVVSRPCIAAAHRRVFDGDDETTAEEEEVTDGSVSCGVRSPFCLVFEGSAAHQQLLSLVEAAMRNAVAAMTSTPHGEAETARLGQHVRVAVLVHSSSDADRQRISLVGLPFTASADIATMRRAHSMQYRFFARVFRNAVVRGGAVLGGLEQF